MSATMVDLWRKISKLHWLKRPKTVPKTRLGPENNWFKTSFWSLSFNFRFSSRKFQSQQKLAKKDDSFYNTVSLKKPQLFYKRQLTYHGKNLLPQNPLILQIFHQTNSWLVLEKTLHCTISRRPRTAFSKQLESKCLYFSVYLLKRIFVPEM